MRYHFLDTAEPITQHYGIRPTIFEGAITTYAVVMLQDPDVVLLCLIKRPAAVQYCIQREREIFGNDSVEE